MKNFNIEYSLIFLSLLFLPITTSCQSNQLKIEIPESVGLSSDSLLLMKQYLNDLVDTKQLAGVQTAICRKGKLIHFDSYGFADIEEKKQLDEKSIFRIFSMTKPIVSVALLQLFEQGKFKLDDPLSKFIPSFKNHWTITETGDTVQLNQQIRIIDLLRHTSGFGYGRGSNERINQLYTQSRLNSSSTNEMFIQKLSTLPISFEPGSNWEYGYSTNVCGYLIELFSGKPLDEYLQESILLPLEMNDTHFQLPKEKIKQFTTGYRAGENNELIIAEPYHQNRYTNEVTLFNGGGGLVSTTLDYLNFCKMLLNKGTFNKIQILQPKTVELMITDHLPDVRKINANLRLPSGETGFGLGVAINSSEGQLVYGWGGAVGTYFRVDPQNELIYILMIQLSPYRQLNLRTIFQNYVNSALLK